MKKILRLSVVTLLLFSVFVACEKEEEEKKVDLDYELKSPPKNILEGRWSATMQIDSIVIVFEEGEMKEYLYEKGGTSALERISYGRYYLYQENYFDGKVVNYIQLYFYESYYDNEIYYDLKEDSLALYSWRAENLKLVKIK